MGSCTARSYTTFPHSVSSSMIALISAHSRWGGGWSQTCMQIEVTQSPYMCIALPGVRSGRSVGHLTCHKGTPLQNKRVNYFSSFRTCGAKVGWGRALGGCGYVPLIINHRQPLSFATAVATGGSALVSYISLQCYHNLIQYCRRTSCTRRDKVRRQRRS